MGKIFKTFSITAAAVAGWMVAAPASAAPAFQAPMQSPTGASALLSTLGGAAVGSGAETWQHYRRDGRRHYHSGRRYRSSYDNCRRGRGTTGMILGGAAGALLGRELDGGRNRTTGTVVGAAGGALLGREIQRNRRCR